MSEALPQPKSTPNRRKHGRQGTRSAAQKAYASENDVAALESTRRHAPKTPSKTVENPTPVTDYYSSHHSNSRSGTTNKTRHRNLAASPESAQHGRRTPPEPPISTRPGANSAFAGATFHASPAPSALPIPSFLSKSSSDSPVTLGKGSLRELSPPPTDGDVPSPFRPSSVPQSTESPLDFMFRAHREEKERLYNYQSRSPRNYESPPPLPWGEGNPATKSSSLPHSRRTHPRQGGGIDFSELNGTPGRPLGPAFSTPYQERIKAARSVSNSNTPSDTNQTAAHSKESLEDPTAALKKFLFGNNGPSPVDSFSTGIKARPTNPPLPAASESGTTITRTQNIEELENDLRRILKLDKLTGSSSDNHFPLKE